jgi:plasmid stability protein
MSAMIQIRHVPDKIHRQLKSRAALAGMSMSEYILQELKKSLERPTRQELLDRLASLPEPELSPSPAEVIRAERERR